MEQDDDVYDDYGDGDGYCANDNHDDGDDGDDVGDDDGDDVGDWFVGGEEYSVCSKFLPLHTDL